MYDIGIKTYTSNKERRMLRLPASTVSATFMIITANTLDILDHWSIYFFITMVITFVNAHLYPLRSNLDTTYNNVPYEAEGEEKVSFKMAWHLAMDAFEKAPGHRTKYYVYRCHCSAFGKLFAYL